MSVESTYTPARFHGNGVTVDFEYSFRSKSESVLRVYLVDRTTGAATLKVLNSDYTVALDADFEGGTVTFGSAPSSAYDVLIKRSISRTQGVNLPPVSNFSEQDIEDALDEGVMIDQEFDETLQRCIKFSETSEESDVDFPDLEANKYLRVNALANGLELGTPSATTTDYPGSFDAGPDADKAVSPTTGDIYFATDTRITYVCYSSGTWKTISPDRLSVFVAQTAHGLAVGDVVRHNGTSYTKAKADTEANAQAVGVVSEVTDANHFELTIIGGISGLSGLSAGSTYYLSPSTAGALTATKPSNYVKPVLIATSTTAGFVMQAGVQVAQEDHFREGLSVHWESGTDTIAIEAGCVRIGGALVRKADRTTLAIGTAGNYAGGSSLRATNTVIWVGIDSAGNLRIHTTAATHADFALSVTTGKLRYVTWSGTVYRVIGWIRTNGTGSGEIDSTRAGNIKDVNTRNVVYYEKTATTTGSTTLPIDTSIPQAGEGTEMLRTGIVIGDAKSKIKAKSVLTVENSAGGNGAGVLSCLFKSGTADAKRTTGSTDSTGTAYSNQNQEIKYQEAAGAVGWQEWFVSCGQAGSAVTLNYFQGTAVPKLASVLELEEIDP